MEGNRRDGYRRNYLLGIANGALVNFGMAFIEPYTVLPVFILRLGGSQLLVGLASAIAGTGWFLPQIFVSRLSEQRSRLIGVYRWTALVRIVGWAGVVAVLWWMDPSSVPFYLGMFFFFYTVAHLGAGVAAVPFLEVAGKTIEVTSRGRFFGTRRLIGGCLGIVAGVLVSVVLGNEDRAFLGEVIYGSVDRIASVLGLTGLPFPHDYGILFLFGSVLISIGLGAFCLVEEPPSAVQGRKDGFLDHMKRGFLLLWKDKYYRLFYLVRICWQLTAMAFPFYASYAFKRLGYTEHNVGFFLSLWVGSNLFSNYFWGKMMDRNGNKLVLEATALLSILPPLGILLVEIGGLERMSGSATLYAFFSSTFFVNGFIRSGRVISNITYLLEFAPQERRPLYIGLMNSFTFPFMLSPALGGVILKFFPFHVLFSVSLFFALLDLALSTRLREPRDPGAASHAI